MRQTADDVERIFSIPKLRSSDLYKSVTNSLGGKKSSSVESEWFNRSGNVAPAGGAGRSVSGEGVPGPGDEWEVNNHGWVRLCDNAYQRQFRNSTPFYRPVSWYVPSAAGNLGGIMRAKGSEVWQSDGFEGLERCLCNSELEWHDGVYEGVEVLLKKEAYERVRRMESVLVGEREKKEVWMNEVGSLLPVTDYFSLLEKLGKKIDPSIFGEINIKNNASQIKDPIKKRPFQIYSLLINQHPLQSSINPPIETQPVKINVLKNPNLAGANLAGGNFAGGNFEFIKLASEPPPQKGPQKPQTTDKDLQTDAPTPPTKEHLLRPTMSLKIKLKRNPEKIIDLKRSRVPSKSDLQSAKERSSKPDCNAVSLPIDWKFIKEPMSFQLDLPKDFPDSEETKFRTIIENQLNKEANRRKAEEEVSLWMDQMHQKIIDPIIQREFREDRQGKQPLPTLSDHLEGDYNPFGTETQMRARSRYLRTRGGFKAVTKFEREFGQPWRKPFDTNLEIWRRMRFSDISLDLIPKSTQHANLIARNKLFQQQGAAMTGQTKSFGLARGGFAGVTRGRPRRGFFAHIQPSSPSQIDAELWDDDRTK